jgi:hypothetical protein
MTDAPKLNRFGKPYLPPLTSDQKAILLDEFSKGSGATAAAQKAGCGEPKARAFRNDWKTANAIRELQITTAITQTVAALKDLAREHTQAVKHLSGEIKKMRSEQNKLRAAVAYQKLGLNKARKELRDSKTEARELRRLLHQKTGLMPPK